MMMIPVSNSGAKEVNETIHEVALGLQFLIQYGIQYGHHCKVAFPLLDAKN